MKKKTRRVLFWILFGLDIPFVLYCLFYRFAHPMLTETQLFLELMPLIGSILVLSFAAGFFLDSLGDGK